MLIEQDKSAKEVAELFGLKERSVRHWRQEAKSPKKKSERRRARPLTIKHC